MTDEAHNTAPTVHTYVLEGSLNEILDKLDAQIGKLGLHMGESALSILDLMDEASAMIAELDARRQPLQTEKAQFASISHLLQHEARTFLKAIGGSAVLEKARGKRHPPESAWWWYLDRGLMRERKWRARRLGYWLAGGAAIVLILSVAYKVFLAPDPQTLAQYQAKSDAESLIQSGDWTGALSALDKGLAVNPQNAQLLILKGGIEQKLGQSSAAETVFAQAEQASGSQETFLRLRMEMYLFIGEPDLALQDIQQAKTIAPDSATVYTFEGQAYEDLGQLQKAMTAYQQAVQLADAQNLSSLSGEIRVKMAFLSQKIMSQGITSPTP